MIRQRQIFSLFIDSHHEDEGFMQGRQTEGKAVG